MFARMALSSVLLWLNVAEGAKFWLSCLTDLKNRGVTDIFITCVDGLTGFPEVIQTALPQARVQLCIVHLVRAALKYVTEADSRAAVRDLRNIYQAATVLEAEQALQTFGERWDAKTSDDLQTVDDEVATHHFNIRSAAGDPQSDLHDEHDRVRESCHSQVHTQPKTIPEPRVGIEADLHRDPRSLEELNDAHPQVERSPQPLRNPR